MEFLFRPRSNGKRQVKPSQDIAFLEEQIAGDESSDDSEFRVGNDDDEDEADTSDSGSSSEEHEEENSSSEDDLESEVVKLSTDELVKRAENAKSSGLISGKSENDSYKKVPICGCCLGQTSTDANEIVECDACGISVHEGCYGISEATSEPDSELSAASTEPWFCEPCRSGLMAPPRPPCQLCPKLGGLYKATDCGQWVHLVCALYVPGVAFADPDSLTRVTLFELSYASYGRRACSICADSDDDGRLARTGICVGCDAGLCKNYFHATCAHAHGLLSEPSYNEGVGGAAADNYLAHCRVHTDRTTIKRRRHAYLAHVTNVNRRRAEINAQCESEGMVQGDVVESEQQRIKRKLAKQRDSYKKDLEKRPSTWVPTQKLPRLLTTSASAIRKIEKMGEIQGISVKRQRLEEEQVLSAMEAHKRWHVPPSFPVGFVSYFGDRQERIDELKQKLADQTSLYTTLRSQEATLQPKFDQTFKSLEEAQKENKSVREKVTQARNILNNMGKKLPDNPSLRPIAKAIDIVTPNVKAKATLWSSAAITQSNPIVSTSPLKLKQCGICKSTKDQHLLVHCDTCLLFYHLGCLTPPLTRMPKKSKLYGWQCSECDKDSSSEDDGKNKLVASEDAASTAPTRKRRMAAAKAIAASSRNVGDREIDLAWEEIEGNQKIRRKKKTKAMNGPSTKEEPPVILVDDSESGPLNDDAEEKQRNLLIANAKLSSEEKQRRKELKRERRKRKKEKRKRREQELMMSKHRDEDEEDNEDCDIVEQENGQIIVSIKPKTIKLKIKAPKQTEETTATTTNADSVVNGFSSNRHEAVNNSSSSNVPPPPEKKPRKRSSASSRDIRTFCDKCQSSGDNSNLVRCDECSKCFHFSCLIPPLKKSPKVAGYGWHCTDCDPECDTDWHLD